MTRPHPISWLRTHPRAADVALAAFVTVLAVTIYSLGLEQTDNFREPSWWTASLVVLSLFPIAWRRTHPIGSALFVVLAQTFTALLDIDGTGFLGVVISLYSLGAYAIGRHRGRAVWAIATTLTLLFGSGLIVAELEVGTAITTTFILVTAFVVGDNVRRRREKAEGLVERAERAEREQMLLAQQQVHAERTRIARELHDVVAHSVSVMVIQAAAARRNLVAAPESAEIALGNIETTGRQTMTELRGILGVLRADARAGNNGADNDSTVASGAALAPQPTGADLIALIESSTDLPIRLDLDNSPDDSVGDNLGDSLGNLSSSVALTAHRVVQEAITNVRRHAGPVTSVRIGVHRHLDRLSISIVDDGRGAAANDLGPGFGVVGMRERVAAVGGKLQVGPRPGGGWAVKMSIPVTGTETDPPSSSRADLESRRPMSDQVTGVTS